MDEAVGLHADELVIERAGCVLHAWVYGPDAAPLVVLTHGAAMDRRLFDAQLEPVVASGYRVMTVDLRGHGQSKPVGDVAFNVASLSDDVLALVDELDVERFVTVGQSLGGYVSQDLELRYPDRVIAIGVIGSTCITAPISALEQMALRSSPMWFRVWPEKHLRRTVAKSTAATPEGKAYAFRAMNQLTKEEFVTVWGVVARAMQPREGYRIERPFMLTHGDADGTGNIRKTAPAWAEREPQCTYAVIPNAGHNANYDNPASFNRVLLAFLREHVPSA